MLIATIIVAGTGCVASQWFCTGLFLGGSDERTVLISNFHSEQGPRFAIYRLASDDPSALKWQRLAGYFGRVSAAAVHEGAVWAFFEDGAYRVYDISDEHAVQLSAGKLDLKWSPLAAARDSRGRLWVVGVEDGRLAVAMLMGDAWKRRFPPGPRIAKTDEALGRGVLLSATADGDLKVFWHVRGRDRSIMGAAFQLAGDDPALPGASWRELPELSFAVADLRIDAMLAATLLPADGVMLLVRGGVPAIGRWMHGGIWHASLRGEPSAWTEPKLVPDSTEPFRFGGVGGMAWLDRSDGGMLLSSNSQRGRQFLLEGGTWRSVPLGAWTRLYLPELEVFAVLASAGMLVLAGAVVFGLRLRRLRRAGFAPHGPQAASKKMPVSASISARLLAAAFDLMLVGGVMMMLPFRSSPPANPLLPEMMVAARHAALVLALIAYGVAMEAALGATFGKLALGLRVVRADGSRAGFGRIVARNIFRIVDTGIIGIVLVMVTRRRQRLGDIASDTVVAAVGFRPEAEDKA